MGKQLADDDEPESFDPWLGAVAAETWWRLGSHLATLNGAKTAGDRVKALDAWVKEMRDELEDGHDVSPKFVTRTRLEKFIEDLTSVLESKYKGEPVAKRVESLIRAAGKGDKVEDDGLYLRYIESEDSFWALEYSHVFGDMQRRSKPGAPGWDFAVGYCEDPTCRKFFVKGRSDTRFHSDECRTRTANRAAYQAKKEKVVRGGRPRRVK